MELSFEFIESIAKSFGGRYIKIASGLAFLGLGLMIGIAAKNYIRFLITSFIICFFTIKGLEYNHVLSINWGILNSLLGLPQNAGFSDMITLGSSVCKTHPIQAVSGTIGVIIGFFYLG